MKVYEKRDTPKLCFAQAGQVIRMLNEELEPAGPYYLVVRLPEAPKRGVQQKFDSNGLYSDPDQHGLVDLATGTLCTMPHLSKRMVRVNDAALVIDPQLDQSYEQVV